MNTYRLQPVVPTNDLRIIVGIICSLSIVGSLLIIITYICFKSLRTTTRLILVHLSIMDLGVATANLVGISVNFNKYYFKSENATYGSHGLPVLNHPGDTVDMACKIQAAFAVYFTAGSFLWTLSMAVYIYMRIVHYRTPRVARYTLWIVTMFSYILPLTFVSWKWFTNRLGYSPFSAEGWCGDKLVDFENGERQIILSILAYDVWIWLNYILVPVLYLTVLLFLYQEVSVCVCIIVYQCLCYLYFKLQIKRSSMFVTSERTIYSLDFKLLLIPLAFLLLRIWSFVDTVNYIYTDKKLSVTVHYAMAYLAVSNCHDCMY